MKTNDVAERCALIVRLLRFLRGWSQKKLAEAAGIGRREIFAYESGEYVPGQEVLEKLARAARVPLGVVEIVVPVLLWLQRLTRRRAVEAGAPGQTSGGHDEEKVWTFYDLSPLDEWDGDMEDAALRRETLVACLCDQSVAAAAADPVRALRLAEAALQVAQGGGGGEDTPQLEGYALHFVANAQRVGSHLNEAEATFVRAWNLWTAAEASDRLDGSRLLDLQASLRRDQGRFKEALDLFAQALATCETPEIEGRILLNKAFTLEQMKDVRGAVATLQQAATRIDGRREPRQRNVLLFNLAVLRCHLGRFEEAARLMPELRVLTAEQENRIDEVRLPWLESRILAGQGDLGRAVAALERVQGELAKLTLDYDEALATLELARLYLRQGRTDKTKELAARAEPVFRELNVAPRVLESVLVFLEAARQEIATLELLDQALQALGEERRGR